MTNAKISHRAKMFLRNKKLSSAVAKALASNSHASARDGIVLTINGRQYTVKTASYVSRKDVQKHAQ
jgi:hypothetical protein